jgi:hypothetical protein
VSSYKNLFPGSTVSSRSPVPSSGGELSLRDQMLDILYGTSGGIPKGQKVLVRRMRRDSSENRTLCVCVDHITKEPDIDYPCPSCSGEGYLWDEELLTCYKTNVSAAKSSRTLFLDKEQFGVLSLAQTIFYFDYQVALTKEDRLVIIRLDEEGTPVVPYIREDLFEINLTYPLRSDRGRIEYWMAYCASKNISTVTS